MAGVSAKICGINSTAALDAALHGGASHVGLVFFPPSPRNVSLDQASALGGRVPPHIRTVGVFVNPDDQLVDNAVIAGKLDAIQLHDVTPERASYLKRFASTAEIWVAVPVRTRADLDQSGRFAGAAHRILFDAKPSPGADLPGGNGLRFDWTLLDGFAHQLPWGLSGGLDADNVAEAVGITGARLVDVSSGVESSPGVKDVDKIGAFLQAVARL